MQLAGSLLKLVDAPLDLREALLGVDLQNTDRLDQLRYLDLLLEFFKAALEHAVPCRLPAAAHTTSTWHDSLDVKDQRTEHVPVDILIATCT